MIIAQYNINQSKKKINVQEQSMQRQYHSQGKIRMIYATENPANIHVIRAITCCTVITWCWTVGLSISLLVIKSSDQSCTIGMILSKIHLISLGCPRHSIALQCIYAWPTGQNRGLKQQSFTIWWTMDQVLSLDMLLWNCLMWNVELRAKLFICMCVCGCVCVCIVSKMVIRTI